MGPVAVVLTLAWFLGSAASGEHTMKVFLDKQDASTVITRQRRANSNNNEENQPPNLERECVEEICNYQEALEIFGDTYRTDIFWSVYVDGDQCAEKPCKNGAMCSDSVGGYDCICKSGFSGTHCETDNTVCVLGDSVGCSQFCKPGYMSYECSCARGWKLQDKEKCVPDGSHPCGKVESIQRWVERKSANSRSDYEGLGCNSAECPWQALLQSEAGPFCSGVILKTNLVLTTAQCAHKYGSFQVVVGKRSDTYEEGEQVLYVKTIHQHPRYVAGRPDNDLAAVELRNNMQFKKSVSAVCLPERDFAENVLMAGVGDPIVTGWKETSDSSGLLEGSLVLNHLQYDSLTHCAARHPDGMTNKMFCTSPRVKADCALGPGSPVLSLHRNVFFLTGVLSRPPGHACLQGYVFQKVSRFLPWLQPLMDSR